MAQRVHLAYIAIGWRRLCTSFQTASLDLCSRLASVAKKFCTTYVDPQRLAPLTASRLIALNKCPGIQPIGVGETVSRILGKAILSTTKQDVLEAAGTLQLCVGQEAGSEAAIHAMCHEDGESEPVLLVDASNAFNSLNCRAAPHNIHSLCPPLSIILTNTGTTLSCSSTEKHYNRVKEPHGDPPGYYAGITCEISPVNKMAERKLPLCFLNF